MDAVFKSKILLKTTTTTKQKNILDTEEISNITETTNNKLLYLYNKLNV